MSHRQSFTAPAQIFYDRLSRSYDLLANASEHTSREKGIDLLAARSSERVLEIGFGTGHALVDLARALEPDGEVIGVDYSPGMLRVTRERLRQAEVEHRVRLLMADGRKLPLADRTCDAVFLSFTLELFDDDIPQVLAEIRRVLRADGRLAVVAMSSRETGPVGTVMVDFYRWLHRHFPHFIDCEPIAIASLLEAAGFTVEERSDMAIWGLPVAALLGRPS